MKHTFLKTTIALLSLCVLPASGAASISLVHTGGGILIQPNTIVPFVDDILTFDIVMNFTDVPTIGGGFDVIYNSAVLEFVSLVDNGLGDPGFGRPPDIFDGLIESWAFASFNPITGPGLVGSVTFRVLNPRIEGVFLATGPTSGIGGPFISGVDFITELDVDYNEFRIMTPLPAGVWLMLSAVVALIGVRRRI